MSDRPWVSTLAAGLLLAACSQNVPNDAQAPEAASGAGNAGSPADRKAWFGALHVHTSISFFNVGVEIGQLLFVAVLLAGAALLRRPAGFVDPRWSTVLPAHAIGGLASFWLVERVVAFV
jgi:hypothetical protein